MLPEDSPQAVYWKPADSFVANFIGSGMNMLEAKVTGMANGRVQLKSQWGVFECADPDARVKQGDGVVIGIRPESFDVYADQPSDRCSSNLVRARLELATFTGDGLEFQAIAGSKLIRGRTVPWTPLKVGQDIFLHCPPERCVLLSSSQ
jgi:ABC-type sugar transport system ATPase subunit